MDTDGDVRHVLSSVQLRVLGSLVEKQLTTPQHYPLSLNALMLACNQTSNRDPVVSYDEPMVELAVRTLKQMGFTRFVHPMHGRSVLRYEQVFADVCGLDQRQLAIMAVLMLRGPQTVGELRSRTERMATFDDLADVIHDLELLEAQAGGLVTPIPKAHGQKEGRFTHCLGDTALDDEHGSNEELPMYATPAIDEMVALGDELRLLRRDLDEVRTALGMIDESE